MVDGLVVHKYLHPVCAGNPCAWPSTREVWVPRGSGGFTLLHEIDHVWFAVVPTNEQRAGSSRASGSS
jgi:hypothetical protein